MSCCNVCKCVQTLLTASIVDMNLSFSFTASICHNITGPGGSKADVKSIGMFMNIIIFFACG